MSDEQTSNESTIASDESNISQTPAAEPTKTEAPVQTTAEPINLMDHLSDEMKGQGNLKDFKDINELAKSYVNVQRMVGNSVRIPAEDASAEAKADFLDKIKDVPGVLLSPSTDEDKQSLYNKLGRPDTADGYKLDEILTKEIVQSTPAIQEDIGNFTKTAHELGLTNDQTAALIDMRLEELSQTQNAESQNREAGEAALKKLWGQDYDNRLAGAKKVIGIYAEKYKEDVSALISGPSGNNPAFLNMLSELSTMYKEKGHEGMQQSTFGVTPEGALAKISEKKADIGFMQAYTDDRNPGHKKAVDDLRKLYQIANGA